MFGNNDRKLFQIKGKKIEVILMMQSEGKETKKIKWQKKTPNEGGVGGGGYRRKIIIMKNNKKMKLRKWKIEYL